MLTSYAEDELLFAAIQAGASGYVLKRIGDNDLVQAIERVSRGDGMLDPATTLANWIRTCAFTTATATSWPRMTMPTLAASSIRHWKSWKSRLI